MLSGRKRIYFKQSLDGFVSAFVIWKTGKYHSADYLVIKDKEEIRPVPGYSHYVFLDYTPSILQVQRLRDAKHAVTIYDHHAGSKAIHDLIRNSELQHSVRAYFDPFAKGCCVYLWKKFFNDEVPRVIELVGTAETKETSEIPLGIWEELVTKAISKMASNTWLVDFFDWLEEHYDSVDRLLNSVKERNSDGSVVG